MIAFGHDGVTRLYVLFLLVHGVLGTCTCKCLPSQYFLAQTSHRDRNHSPQFNTVWTYTLPYEAPRTASSERVPQLKHMNPRSSSSGLRSGVAHHPHPTRSFGTQSPANVRSGDYSTRCSGVRYVFACHGSSAYSTVLRLSMLASVTTTCGAECRRRNPNADSCTPLSVYIQHLLRDTVDHSVHQAAHRWVS